MTGPVAIFIMMMMMVMMMMMMTEIKFTSHAISIFTMMMIILSESYPNTNMTGFKWFSKIFESLRFEQK